MLPNVISLLPSYAMLGNPIVLTAVSNNSEDKELTVALCRYGNSEDVLFSESYVVRKNRVPLYVDISDVLKAFVALPALPALPISVAGAHGALSRFLLLTNTTAGSSKEIAILYGQFPAGELIRRELSSSALMREKLVGVYANEARDTPAPFFSLRSRAYAVNLYEGELMPLYFMSETAFELKVFDSGGAEVHRYSYSIGDGQPTVFYLHLAPLVTALRKYFKVVFNGSAAQTIHVALSPNPQSRSLRTATFLNSLGFYEKLLLTGAASRARSFEGADGDDCNAPTRQEFLPELQLYRARGVRREVKERITLQAGYATPDRLLVIADMVNSERILLDGEPVVCTSSEIVTSADADSAEPREVELTFTVANS